MSVADLSRPRRGLAAWALPAVVIAVVAGGGGLLSATSASGHPALPPLTPQQLLTKVQTAAVSALSGVVRESADLGLPSLPGADQAASLSWASLISGTHSAKLWVDGAGKQRLALLGTLSEADVVRNGRDLWTYTSTSNQVSHTLLPTQAAPERGPTPATSPVASYSPSAFAARLLAAISPTTKLSVGDTGRVARRDTYTLIISPRDDGSTIRQVTIAVDAKRFVPLQVQVFGAASAPAFQIGFTHVSFSTPQASIFNFRSPAGATVVRNPLQPGRLHEQRAAPASGSKQPQPRSAAPRPAGATAPPKVIGTGWTTVVEFPDGLPTAAAGGLISRLTQPAGTAGERVLTTALVNAVMLSDGRVFLGAVGVSTLEHLAATTPR